MSLLTTSDTSMVKIMKCLDNKSDRNTLRNLLKCSYKVKKVADDNDFSKPEAKALIFLGDVPNRVIFGEYLVDTKGERLPWKTTNERRFAIPDTESKTMEKILLHMQSKTKWIKHLGINHFTLNADMVEVLRKNVNFIRKISYLFIYDIRIEGTNDHILQLMKLFDNLDKICIIADLPATCRITNEILSLVKSSVEIRCMNYKDAPFPQITSSICDFWIEKKTIKSIKFKEISTEIPISSARRMIEHLSNDPKCVGDVNFGTLKYSNDFYRELAIFNKKRGFNFSIKKSLRLWEFVITYEDSGAKFMFQVISPMELSFFETMLDDLKRLRVECDPFQNADLEIRRPFIQKFREHLSNLQVYYYRFIEGITRSATVRGFRNEMMPEITTLEQEIRVIMEKLKNECMESDNLAEH